MRNSVADGETGYLSCLRPLRRAAAPTRKVRVLTDLMLEHFG